MQLKKIALSLALVSAGISTAAYADNSGNFNGFYGGVNLGYSYQSVKETASLNNNPYSDPAYLYQNSFSVGPSIGYGQTVYKNIYLGEEAFFNYTTPNKLTSQLSNVPFQLNNDYNFGAALLPGYVVEPNLLVYGRFAFGQQHYAIKTIDGNGNLFYAGNTPLFLGAGVGVSYAIIQHLRLRLEYEHDFAQPTTIHPTPNFVNYPQILISNQIWSNSDKATLGILYQF